jgi:hypothetical protein
VIPPRYSLQQVAAALEESAGHVAAAAQALGCAGSTIYAYMARSEQVRAAWERGRATWGIDDGQRRGRPVYSPRQVAAALEQAGGSVRAAARALGCAESTVRKHRARYAVVREAYRRAYEASASAGSPRPGPAPDESERSYYRPEEVARAVTQAGGRLRTAADLLKCSYPTACRYIRRFPEVREAYDAARALVIDKVESKLIEAVDRGDLSAVFFVLSTLGKDRGFTKRWGPGDYFEDDDMAELLAMVQEWLGADDGDWDEEGDEGSSSSPL